MLLTSGQQVFYGIFATSNIILKILHCGNVTSTFHSKHYVAATMSEVQMEAAEKWGEKITKRGEG